jgi:hypothetical protein
MIRRVEVKRAQQTRLRPADRQSLEGGIGADPLHLRRGKFELEFELRVATHVRAPEG